MKSFLTIAVLILPLSVFAEGGLPTQPYIYVQGKAEIEKPADMVTLRFEVVAHNASQDKANQEAQGKAGKIFALLESHKIPHDDVVAGDLSSQADYEEDENGTRRRGKLVGYSVTRTFWVKVRDVTAFSKIIDEVLAMGSLSFSGIDPGLINEKELKGQMWEKALTNAREQAEKTLMSSGMKIDSIFAISPIPFPEIHQKIFGSSDFNGRTAEEVSAGLASKASVYRLAPISISQNVHVIYLISPGAK